MQIILRAERFNMSCDIAAYFIVSLSLALSHHNAKNYRKTTILVRSIGLFSLSIIC